MNYAVIVVLLFVGLAQCQEKTADTMMMDMPEGFNSSRCIYRPEEKILSCRGSVETIECNAECDTKALGSKFENKYSIYGIGLVGEKSESIESTKYFMYPRKLDNSSYVNHTVIGENGKVFNSVIGCGDKFIDVVGMRIPDCKCFERLVKIFESGSRVPQMVRLETEPTVVQEIPLIGEILVLDKNVQKRWLWGYGWGSWGWSPYASYGYWWGK